MHIYRMDKNIQERSNATGTVLPDSHGQHQVLEDDNAYSNVDDLEQQQQMIVVSGNPACRMTSVPMTSVPVQHHDHAYSNIEYSQEQGMLTATHQAHGITALGQAVSAK